MSYVIHSPEPGVYVTHSTWEDSDAAASALAARAKADGYTHPIGESSVQVGPHRVRTTASYARNSWAVA